MKTKCILPIYDRCRTMSLLVAACCLLSSVGCSDRLKTYPVKGRVQFTTGGPVHVGTIELKSREHGVQARGTLNNDGTFELTTYEEGDGAVAGTHDCVLVQFVMTEDVANHRPSVIGVVDPRYNSYATSDLKIDIDPAGSNEVLLEVEGLAKVQPPANDHKH